MLLHPCSGHSRSGCEHSRNAQEHLAKTHPKEQKASSELRALAKLILYFIGSSSSKLSACFRMDSCLPLVSCLGMWAGVGERRLQTKVVVIVQFLSRLLPRTK